MEVVLFSFVSTNDGEFDFFCSWNITKKDDKTISFHILSVCS